MDIISKDSKLELVRLSHSITIQDSLKAPILKNLESHYGKDNLATVIAYQIIQTAGFFNLTNNIREEQALETAYLILEKYPTETLEDFTLVFKNAKTGDYGKSYNRLDGQIIFEWIAKYLDKKAEYREKAHNAIKFGSGKENLFQTIQIKAKELEASEVPKNGKSVIHALKEGLELSKPKNKFDPEKYKRLKTEFIQNRSKSNTTPQNE